MCGITGIIVKHRQLPEGTVTTVEQMNAALVHRGPDELGSYDDSYCALAMRRLAIIDLNGGQQPAYNETEDVLVFLNGEIYNYRELKKDLEIKGHTFKTNSDTEVLTHLYEEYQESMFSYLNGMYAFCLSDKRKRKHIIGRDPFGEKPLYYSDREDKFSFSSELKSLLEDHEVPRILNSDALAYYLRTSLIPETITLFKDVKTLAPGHFIRIENGQVSTKKYFSIRYPVNADIKTEQDAVAFIKPKLEQAVKRQTVSDVPVGAFLSGGIDSSTMVALLQKQASKPIQTFNVKFEDDAYDESPIAKAVAKHCRTEHHEITVPNYEFTEDIFWDIIDHVGQPFRDSSAIPTYFITKKIREHVKVAISGDGGDELFGGYSLFQWYLKILKVKQVPLVFRKLLGEFTGVIGLINASKSRQIHRVLQTADQEEENIPIALNEMFTDQEISKLLDQSHTATYSLLKTYPDESTTWSSLRKIMYYRTQHTLTGNMLVKVDRMSMANSLEVRAPFLDKDLFEASAQLPDRFLINGGVGKYILRSIMKSELPEEVFNHPKQGFNIPLYKYQNENFRKLAQRLLFDENPLPELFEKTALERIFNQGLEMKQDNNQISVFRASHQLWMIMQFLGWAERFKVS